MKVKDKYRKIKEKPIKLNVELYPPDRRRRDIDNINKALLDALQNAGVYKDDNQIVRLIMTKYEPVKNGKVIVNISTTKQPKKAR